MDAHRLEQLRIAQAAQGENARQHYRVTQYAYGTGSTYVEAEARTGSRYSVVVTDLPDTAAQREGGGLLVTVVQPWQTCYVIGRTASLHEDYLLEKLVPRERDRNTMHGGDLKALCLTVNEALLTHSEMHAGTVSELAKELGL